MTMESSDGGKFVSQVDYPKGSIQNPMSDAELRAKFNSLAAPVLGEKRAGQLADLVERVERLPSVRSLMRLTAPAARS
jgi:2-methylcitrate dehydratase PrpD